MKKVYCENCIFLDIDTTEININYHCNAPENVSERIRHTWLKPMTMIDRKEHPSVKNKINACKLYKEK